MDERLLNSEKKTYLKIPVPQALENEGWNRVRTAIISQNHVQPKWNIFPRLALASFVILVVFSSSVIVLAQSANPGEPLYDLKLMTDSAFAKITKQPEIIILKRGQEVINSAIKKHNSTQVQQATTQYEKALEEASQEAKQNPNQKEQIKKTLDEQSEKFDQTVKENPSSQKDLQNVKDETEKIKGEVQGVAVEATPSPQATSDEQQRGNSQNAHQENSSSHDDTSHGQDKK